MRQTSLTATLLSTFLAFIVWFMFAPTQLGGKVTYVIVDGSSMESKFHLGDLLLIRKTSEYRIGDAVTYQNAEMGQFVFHRIVDLSPDRFILKGDNNAWTDTYQPTKDEIVGKLWVHIPKLGKAIEWLRSPVNLAIAVALLGGSLMYGMVFQPNKKEKQGSKLPVNLNGSLEVLLYGAGFIVLAFLGLCIFAFTRPLSKNIENIPYQKDGNFFYSATGAPGIYDTDKVRSGEPIFPKLTCYLNIGYSYSVTSSQLQEVSGRHRLYARVLDEKSGWQRTLPMTAENVFNGNSFLAMSTLDLCQVQALVDMVELETGLHESTYTLEIVAHSTTEMRIAGQTLTDSFEPALKLKFDDVHFYLADLGAQEDPFYFSEPGLVAGAISQPNTLSFLGMQPSVFSVRLIGLSGFLLSLFSLLGIGWNTLRGTRSDRDAFIRLKFGGLLMDVQEYAFDASTPFIDVNTIDDLARMAERQNTMILHATYRFTDFYLVQTPGITYRYVAIHENKGFVEIEPAGGQNLGRGGETGIVEYPGNRIVSGDFEMKTEPVPPVDLPQKIILRYTLNTNGNADLSYESGGR